MSYQANNDGDTLSHLAFEPPQWAQETSQREQGGLNSAAGQNANHFGSKPPMKKPGVGANLPASGSPVVAAFKERMAAVKEKQSGLMDLFSPVKPSFRQDPVSRTGVVSDGERAASETFELSTPNLLNSKSAIDNTNASIALFSPMADRKTVSETNSPTDSVIAAEKAHGRYGGLGSSDPVSRLQSALQELKTQTPGHILVSTSSEIQRPRSPSISQPTKNLTIATGTKLSNTAAAESTLRDFGAAPLTGETPTEPDSALAFIMNTNTAGPSTPVPSVSSGGLANGWNEKVILKNLPGSPGHTAVPLVGIKLLPPPSARHPLASVTHASNDEVSGTSAKNEIATDSDSEFVVGEVDDEFNDPEGDAAAGNTSITAGNFSEVVSVESNLRNDTVLSGDCDVDCDFWTCNEVVRTEPDQQDWKAGISIAESHEGIVNGGIGYEGVDDSGIQVVEGGVGNEGYAHKVLEAVLESCLDDFRKQVREEIQNMHVELLRQFCIQKKEMNDLFLAHSPTQELVKEVVRLREENARLRCGFK
ncbi:Protein nedd1 [Entophlyctis luteolus]|nr:Protein nedd1 [Entophlyctis luteolus]